MSRQWAFDSILTTSRYYQRSCVLMAAAELEIFDHLADGPRTAKEIAEAVDCDARRTSSLLDALAAMEILDKHADRYAAPPEVLDLLTTTGRQSVLAMVQHQANCMRRWGQLACAVRSGRPADRAPSVRGEAGDKQSFIDAMDNINRTSAGPLVAELAPIDFHHLLDVGGASGTWTIAFLQHHPGTTATIFDLPHVIPMARDRIDDAGFTNRVALVPGDFETDPLPPGADLALLSAIIHQNSRDQNRALYRKTHDALEPGGRILIRDIVMDDARTAPRAGALFAINMLVSTPAGGTFTFSEIRDDLHAAHFTDVRQLRHDDWMDSFVSARK